MGKSFKQEKSSKTKLVRKHNKERKKVKSALKQQDEIDADFEIREYVDR